MFDVWSLQCSTCVFYLAFHLKLILHLCFITPSHICLTQVICAWLEAPRLRFASSLGKCIAPTTGVITQSFLFRPAKVILLKKSGSLKHFRRRCHSVVINRKWNNAIITAIDSPLNDSWFPIPLHIFVGSLQMFSPINNFFLTNSTVVGEKVTKAIKR